MANFGGCGHHKNSEKGTETLNGNDAGEKISEGFFSRLKKNK